jgi:undecaprenyl pyrophosphate synthase
MNLSWLLQTAVVMCLGIIGYFLKDLKKSFEQKISNIELKIDASEKRMSQENDKMEKRIEELQKNFNDYKDYVSEKYTLKDDFIRAVSTIDKKLDKIYDVVVKRGEP